jgi:hypothetical protein
MMVNTAMMVPVETAQCELERLLERLHLGETITLVTAEGTPLAVMVSHKPAPSEGEWSTDWEERWDALTQKVSQAWKSDKSAVETLMEMRQDREITG